MLIDQNWSEFIGIGVNARLLIGIDQHWALIKGVMMFYVTKVRVGMSDISHINSNTV